MNFCYLTMTLTLAMPPIGSEVPLECAVQVFSRDAWFEAAGDVITLPFQDLVDPGTLVIVTDQYQDCGVLFTDGNDWVDPHPIYPNDGVGLNGYDSTITVEFDPPIYWAAVDLPECDKLWLYSGDQLILATEDCFGSDYAGVGSTVPIDRMIIDDNPGCPCIDDFHFSRTPVTIDCNGNGVADLIEVSEGCESAPDCNQNLIPDECDIGLGPSHDCDGNGIPDECEVAHWHTVSDEFAPFGTPLVATLAFTDIPAAGSDVQVRITVSADLDDPLEFIAWVKLDEYLAGEVFFMKDGLHCADPPQELILTIPADQYNALIEDDGEVEVRVRPSGAVDIEDCPASFVAVELSYFTFAEKDLDFTGIPDVCETIPGNFDTDGDVDFTDLLTLLAAWGDCPSGEACPADLDMSGSVGFEDLLLLLSNWS